MSKDNKNFFFSFIDKINFFKKKNSEETNIEKIKKKEKSFQDTQVQEKKTYIKKGKQFINFLKDKFKKTKENLHSIFKNIFVNKKIDSSFFKKLEEKLISADVNFKTIEKLLNNVKNNLNEEELQNSNVVLHAIKKEMINIFKKTPKSLFLSSNIKKPIIIILVGVNGVGKTTTVVKLAKLYKNNKQRVLVSAADTFRVAAVDQVENLCKNNNIPVISKNVGSDPASVVYDSVQKAISQKFDVLVIDTAGRLHTKINLMHEIKKIIRVIKKINGVGPTEILLTIDSCTGQNALIQAKEFNKFLGITGLILTKFDGTSKGGIVLSIADKFSIPIRYVTSGESLNDIYFFDKKDFINSIFKF
ncbi:signal recognition particle-docking protein FtsY [Buchnera aphidicola]|uniref:signal recognition particle-docking protein FtsY n=1 Tax=Buchnera aphidicola TaxID=9 RepID=UPI002093C20E|nr:signal recognition particle-docking protein FtsY [Buchnera aphidicola]USS94157.1 signal recognition particle-docking protein FtsY [Buchnera aphidicola (Sipha maydis)]WII23705.1 signal recognition particle-docking protein FtsY [Buchnera aphidicola (Sipha maydis)]